MDSYLPKSYPSLMEGKKILYVHGFLSAGSTHTADVLRQFMPRATVLAPDLPVHPAEEMALLKETVESERPDLIIGTSMGGMYTEMLYGFDRICVNPAFEMGATMSEHQMMGKQTFQNPRQDGVQEIIVTKALVKEYREMTEHCFSQVTAEEQQRDIDDCKQDYHDDVRAGVLRTPRELGKLICRRVLGGDINRIVHLIFSFRLCFLCVGKVRLSLLIR